MSGKNTTIGHGDVGDVSGSVRSNAKKIESDTSDLVGLYQEDIERIERRDEEVQGSLNPYDVGVGSAGISDGIDVESETGLSVSIDAENVGRYVEQLSENINRVGSRINQVKVNMDVTGGSADDTRQEIADAVEAFDSEEVLNSLEGGRLDDMESRLSKIENIDEVNQKHREQELEDYRRIKETLEKELVNVINWYSSEAYGNALGLAKQIAGEERDNSEMEHLDEISSSRQKIIENAGDPDDYEHAGSAASMDEPLDVSREALIGQGALIGHMATQMRQASKGMDSLYKKLVKLDLDYVDTGDIETTVENKNSLDTGYDNLANAVRGDYDSIEEAVKNQIQQGLMEDEDFPEETLPQDFDFETNQIAYPGSLEEA
jgi:hypothetical protein